MRTGIPERRQPVRKYSLASMVLSAAIAMSLSLAPVLAAEDGDVLVDLTFDKDTENFMIYTEGGTCDISNTEGRLDIKITSCGQLDYANQVYYDGFGLEKGAVYTYSFDVSSDVERQIEYRIQLNGGDYRAYVGDFIDIGPDEERFIVDWTMEEESDPAPRIAFNLGLMPDMEADPGEHHVYIDNISLVLKDASGAEEESAEEEEASPEVAVNQTGYRPDDGKTVFVQGEDASGAEFSIVDVESETELFEGVLSEAVRDEASGEMVCRGDFSDFDMEGEFKVLVRDPELESPLFRIDEHPYDELYRALIRMLCLQRCGTESDEEIAGDFAHGSCHTEDAVIYGTEETMDVSGGWHDAGDYGRYVVSGAKAVADLFYAYEMGAGSLDDAGIPESGNGISDLLDEARYELDWLLKMQDPESGGVYHKVTRANFPGEVFPEEETDELILSPVSTAATGDFAAVMAKAARIYKEIDEDFADEAMSAALRAWDYLETHEAKGFTNPPEISTGEYPDEKTGDESFFAAVELYLSGEDSFRDKVLALYKTGLGMGLGWADVSGYAALDLVESSDEGIAEAAEMAEKVVLGAADALLEKIEGDRYNASLGIDYYWGSNMGAANNGMVLLEAASLAGADSARYQKAAKEQLDYLLGANSLGYSFVTAYGGKTPENPHHRPSQAVGYAMPGMLVGGPDCHLEDPYAQAVLDGAAPAKCYVDNSQSYSTNEVAVYWNSPLIALIAGLV